MRFIVQIARILVAITFIFSGFVKLVDPLGSAYKFQEYFGADVLNMEFLIPYALPFSIFLILAEIMLGVKLLVGFKPKITTWSLFVLILIFLFLTWYSAYFNKVTDCGCFGDAVKLSPWETFYKNVVLVVLIIILLIHHKVLKPFPSSVLSKWISFISFIVFLFITYYVLQHLPIIDFRPYAVGKNISEGMLMPEEAKEDVYKDTWIYHVNGEDREFTTEEEPWNMEGATFVDRKTELIEKGYEPPIHDFSLMRGDEDLTQKLLAKDKLMLVVMYNLAKTNKDVLPDVAQISSKALQQGYDVFALSAAKNEDFLKLKERYELDFDLLFCDETTIKTIIRANPGIVTIEKGTITGKWNATDVEKVKL